AMAAQGRQVRARHHHQQAGAGHSDRRLAAAVELGVTTYSAVIPAERPWAGEPGPKYPGRHCVTRRFICNTVVLGSRVSPPWRLARDDSRGCCEAGPTMSPILVLEKISKRFGAVVIAEGIDLA